MRSILFLLFIGLLGCSLQKVDSSAEESILQILDTQTDCWNAGDIDCFMQSYWKSDSLVFVGSRGLTYGWHNTLLNYRKSYPSAEAMGALGFEVLKIEAVSKDSYFVIGKWHLSRAIGDIGGHFSLLWRKIDGQWVIVADHSS